jgi:hypothetical protein
MTTILDLPPQVLDLIFWYVVYDPRSCCKWPQEPLRVCGECEILRGAPIP